VPMPWQAGPPAEGCQVSCAQLYCWHAYSVFAAQLLQVLANRSSAHCACRRSHHHLSTAAAVCSCRMLRAAVSTCVLMHLPLTAPSATLPCLVCAASSRRCSCRLQQPSWLGQVHRDTQAQQRQQQQQHCSMEMMGCCSHRR
jgi:hypothetical protein